MCRPLPLEVWLLIIDELGAQGEYDALEACAEASEGLLKERAERSIPQEMTFRTQEEAASISVRQRWDGPREVRIEGGRRSGERLPIPHLETFASRLARKWFNVHALTIERAEWRAQDLDLPSVLLNLACLFPPYWHIHSFLPSFNSIRHLRLHEVTFPTVLTFWRLVCALPSLSDLYLRDIKFVKTAINARTLSALRPLCRTTMLRTICVLRPDGSGVERPGSLAMYSVTGLLLMPFIKMPPWVNVSNLHLWEVTLPTAAAFAHVLCALPALAVFAIQGPCSFLEHGFDPKDIPMQLGKLSKLRNIELGKVFSICSDPQSVHDLVDILFQTGTSVHLDTMTAWLSPSLRVVTCIDVTLNRLIKHAGQSLKILKLERLQQDGLPLSNEAFTYAAPSTACYFDISANTQLEYLTCAIDIGHDDVSPIAPVVELLHQASSEHISNLWLRFHVKNEADLETLWTGFPQLDAVLSRDVFNKLEKVWIKICLANKSTATLVATVKSLLPELGARGILHIRVVYA